MSKVTIDQALQVAIQHHQSGNFSQAEAIYRQILTQQPGHAQALHWLGVLAGQAGRFDEAVSLILQAIAGCPQDAGLYNNLGKFLTDAWRFDEAVAACRRAIALRPQYAAAYFNLGLALQQMGALEEAIAAYRQAQRIDPNLREVQHRLGSALYLKGEFGAAEECLRETLGRMPSADAWASLAAVLNAQDRYQEAVLCCREALRLDPTLAEAHNNLGLLFFHGGQLADAVTFCREAVRLKPDFAQAHCSLAHMLRDTAQIDAAIDSYRSALALEPVNSEVHSNLLLALNYQSNSDSQGRFQEAQQWAKQFAAPLARFIQPHANDRDPNRRLRIGYLSPDFCEHPVSAFLLPLLAHHDHQHCEIFCYSAVQTPDAITAAAQRCADAWHPIAQRSDEAVAELIRSHQIDILVDVSGHTAHNRLLVFARKPAPVQISYLGYPATTGIAAIDYRLTDALADPPGQTEALHTEILWRLPETAWCFDAPAEAPRTELLRPAADRPVCFGSFNTLAKASPETMHLWSRILRAVPDSRLLLKSYGLGDEATCQLIRGILTQHGIDPERILLRGRTPDRAAHLALYSDVDIALDTFPYHGTTTTCEALWMGVPVVTLAGDAHHARVGVSLLTSLGQPQWIAHSPEQFVSIAAGLATDRSALAELRTSLRQKMQASPLMNPIRLAGTVESAYRQMWKKWCASPVAAG